MLLRTLRSACSFFAAMLATAAPLIASAQTRVEGEVFDHGYDETSTHYMRVWVDVNGDGRSDFCRLVNTGRQVQCSLAQPDGTWLTGAPSSAAGTDGWIETRRWADVDGDGLPEFCRIFGNSDYTFACLFYEGGNWSRETSGLQIPVWAPGSKVSQPRAGLSDRNLTYTADVNGDGRSDFCYMHNTDTLPFDRLPATFNLRCYISNGAGFGASYWEVANVDLGLETHPRQWVDMNGDGFADYCRIVGTGPHLVRCTLGGPNGFAGEVTSTGVSDIGSRHGAAFVDFNGDGKADYCRVVASETFGYLRCLLSTGVGWLSSAEITSPSPGLASGDVDNRWWIDVNGDGLTDFCRFALGGIACRLSRGDSFGFSDVTAFGVDAGLRFGRGWCDANGDGIQEFCRLWVQARPGPDSEVCSGGDNPTCVMQPTYTYHPMATAHLPQHAQPAVVTDIHDGLGAVTKITYSTLTDPATYERTAVGGYPRLLVVQPPSLVVREARAVRAFDQARLTGRSIFHYKGLRVDTTGPGSRGFRERWMLNEGNNTLERTVYFQGLGGSFWDDPILRWILWLVGVNPALVGPTDLSLGSQLNDTREIGQVKLTETYIPRSSTVWSLGSAPTFDQTLLVKRTTNTLRDTTPAQPGYRFIGESLTEAWDIDQAGARIPLPTTWTSQQQDRYGNITRIVQETRDGALVWRKTTDNNPAVAQLENWTDDRWILGRIRRAQVTHEAPSAASQLAAYPRSAGTSPNAAANTWTPPAPPPAPIEQVLQAIFMLLLDD